MNIQVLFYSFVGRFHREGIESWLVYNIGRLTGHKMKYMHCALLVAGDVYDLDYKGMTVYDPDSLARERPVTASLTLSLSDYEYDRLLTLLSALLAAPARVSLINLLNYALDYRLFPEPTALICSTYVLFTLSSYFPPRYLDVDELYHLLSMNQATPTCTSLTPSLLT